MTRFALTEEFLTLAAANVHIHHPISAMVITEIPVNKPRVPPTAEIMSNMVVFNSSWIKVMIGVSKKKLRTAISLLNLSLANASSLERL